MAGLDLREVLRSAEEVENYVNKTLCTLIAKLQASVHDAKRMYGNFVASRGEDCVKREC